MAGIIVFGFPYWRSFCSFGGGRFETQYQVSNLGLIEGRVKLGFPARSIDLSPVSTQFWCNLSKPRAVGLIHCIRHNLSPQALRKYWVGSRSIKSWTIDTATDVITCANHSFEAADPVILWAEAASPTTPELPVSTPQVEADTIYYVGSITQNSFKLYPTAGDATAETNAIDFTAGGTGTFYVLGAVLAWSTTWENVWPYLYPFETLAWEDEHLWTGRYTQEEIDALPTKIDRIWFDGAKHFASSYKIAYDDQTNPWGYVEIGFSEPAQGFQPPHNYSPNSDFGHESRSLIQESFGGAASSLRRAAPRVSSFDFNFIKTQQAWRTFWELFKQIDGTEPIAIYPDPEDTTDRVRQDLFGTLQLPLPRIRYMPDMGGMYVSLTPSFKEYL